MSAERAIVYYESAQSQRPFEVMTDTGDRTQFEAAASPWSGASGYEPLVRPYGLATGGQITPASTADTVSVAAATVYMADHASADSTGMVAVSGDEVSVSRGTEMSPNKITSIIVDSNGEFAALAGTAGSSFSEQRGSNGGPPYIPVDAIEIGQVRLSSDTAGAVAENEVMQVVGIHQERTDYPVWEVSRTHGEVHFAEPLPAIHTGDEPKRVVARYATPIFAAIPRASDWTPAETSHSLSSTPIYGGAIGSSSASINQASFTAYLDDGIRDGFLALKNARLWFRFHPDRNRSVPHQLTNGVMGISRSFPADGGITAEVTISPEEATVDVRE